MALEDGMTVLTVVAWLASGLAAVCLVPGNGAARFLLVASILFGLSRSSPLLLAGMEGAPFALLRTFAVMAFLSSLVAIVATLVRYPDGQPDARWHVYAVQALAVVAVTAPLAQLIGSPILSIGDEPAQSNPIAVGGLVAMGNVGEALESTEPLWIVFGVVVLALRWWRGDAERRSQLRWPLRSILLLAILLVAIAVGSLLQLTGVPDAVIIPVFFTALSLFPVALLVGITQRVRALERRLVDSRARLVQAEDVARRTLERDIHDGVQQQLVAILSLTELAHIQLGHDPVKASETITEVGGQARTAIGDLRELVRGIRPPVLADSGLVAALESRLARLPADVRIDASGVETRRWAPGVESAAYFLVNEAVTNSLKHAAGSRILVQLRAVADDLLVQVSDDGPGAGAGAAASSGLTGLRDRVESMGGRFIIDGDPSGTRVQALFPGAV
ncbi:sensor histidine kinase [Homoserinimonas sp. A447]